jgi:gliding motility-associated-like protein
MLSQAAWATHQVGGQIEMKLVGDVPGHYTIIVTNYLEAGQRANAQTGGLVGIFKKSDNTLVRRFNLTETGSRSTVVFTNAFCANQQNLNFVVATFSADLYLTPGDYTDIQGYYMSYQTRNRNGSISNLVNPSQIGYTFYLEFPALQQSGRLVENSSPHFTAINGEYLCLGESFAFPFGGTDPDGDQLRYSLVTPLDQKGTRTVNTVSPGPYPEVTWQSGYSATNAIPGVPAMSINSTTGQLTGKPSKTGLFVFAVNVEEYRNGVKIGEVRRDFQLLVVECPPLTTPDPTVRIQTKSPDLRSLTLCQGQTATIQAVANPDWNYQWRQNGVNLPNATGTSLTVQEAGDYTVYVSLKNACSKAADSEMIQLRVIGTEATIARTGHLCATTGSVSFTVSNAGGATVQWYRDGQRLPTQTLDSIRSQQPGQFYAQLTYAQAGCVARTTTTDVSRSATVLPIIQSQQPQLCPNSTLTLVANGGVSYVWQQDTQPPSLPTTDTTFTTTSVGSYVVTATDFYGCTGKSAPFVVTAVPPVTAQLDSIPDMCGTGVPVVALTGQPGGGVFAGSGVTGNVFSAQLAGIGNHAITYTVKPVPFCEGIVATRRAIVAPIPTISLPDTLVTYYGNTFTLEPTFTGNPDRFVWSPAIFLDNPAIASPKVVQLTGPIVYTLAISNASGCSAADSVRIRVVERVYVPDAFSPNRDGLNDQWELVGIEAFPEAIVTIFNRWGEVIFRSDRGYHQRFDGLSNGDELPAGAYAYTVSTAPEWPVMRGVLMLVR